MPSPPPTLVGFASTPDSPPSRAKTSNPSVAMRILCSPVEPLFALVIRVDRGRDLYSLSTRRRWLYWYLTHSAGSRHQRCRPVFPVEDEREREWLGWHIRRRRPAASDGSAMLFTAGPAEFAENV